MQIKRRDDEDQNLSTMVSVTRMASHSFVFPLRVSGHFSCPESHEAAVSRAARGREKGQTDQRLGQPGSHTLIDGRGFREPGLAEVRRIAIASVRHSLHRTWAMWVSEKTSTRQFVNRGNGAAPERVGATALSSRTRSLKIVL